MWLRIRPADSAVPTSSSEPRCLLGDRGEPGVVGVACNGRGLPPDPPPRREEPIESISSMNIIEGACSRAITNNSLTCKLALHHHDVIVHTPHHAGALPNVFLDQLGARHSNEAALCVVGDGSSEQGLPCPWRPVQQHPLGVQGLNLSRPEVQELYYQSS